MNNNIFQLGITRKPTFKFTITTTSTPQDFTLPLINGGTYNFTVNWGDGTANSTITAYNVGNIHSYAIPGTYTISMWGTCTQFAFNNAGDKLLINKLLDFIDMGFTVLNFYGCSNLTTIASSMKKLKSLTTAVNMFYGCTSLTLIPSGIFEGCIAITTFVYTFRSCTSLTSIPADLFRYNTVVTNFQGTFRNCAGLTSIPTDLFRYNTIATTFSYIFLDCISLTSIPTDLFRYNTVVTNFQGIFQGCTSLTSIPTDLFRYNTIVTNFSYTFYGCAKAQYNINIFYAVGEEGTRFSNKTVNFDSCFYRTSFSGIQGTAPDLWNCDFGTGTPNKTTCYGGAGNSLTSLTNYTDIPVEWK